MIKKTMNVKGTPHKPAEIEDALENLTPDEIKRLDKIIFKKNGQGLNMAGLSSMVYKGIGPERLVRLIVTAIVKGFESASAQSNKIAHDMLMSLENQTVSFLLEGRMTDPRLAGDDDKEQILSMLSNALSRGRTIEAASTILDEEESEQDEKEETDRDAEAPGEQQPEPVAEGGSGPTMGGHNGGGSIRIGNDNGNGSNDSGGGDTP